MMSGRRWTKPRATHGICVYGLQMLAKRNENRLLFDYQRALADQLGFQESNQALAVEQLMQKYYRYSMALSEINDVLLQHFDEDIMGPQSASNTPVAGPPLSYPE